MTRILGIAAFLATSLATTARGGEDASLASAACLEGAPHFAYSVIAESPAEHMAEVQVIFSFEYQPDERLTGAAAALDTKLQGLYRDVRASGRFAAQPLETLLITPRAGSLQASKLLLVGLGARSDLSLDRLKEAGGVIFREIDRLHVMHAAYAPVIRDQGVTTFTAGAVAEAVFEGMLRASDTESRLAQWSDAPAPTLARLDVLAGSEFQRETAQGLSDAVSATRCDSPEPDRSTAPRDRQE